MTTMFSLRSFKLLTVGRAKASTLGEEEGKKDEPDFGLYTP